ncbi:MAG: type II toxin-antitoxin system Phd/YefM family antitoxin [Blastochloris sp.]|nr:type II toxin-antitoxin system Phd/YefM family antitoxin [Blastochloris sp.]
MKSYTYSEARQNFAAVLEQARRDGAVRIQRRDGQTFILTPEPVTASPLDIPGVTTANTISRDDIIQSIQESRRSYN